VGRIEDQPHMRNAGIGDYLLDIGYLVEIMGYK
jgi:hypothetical protein